MNKRKKYHQEWRDRNRQHVNQFSREYVMNNQEQRKLTTKRYRDSVSEDRDNFIRQLIRTARTNANKRNIAFSINFELISAWIIVQNDCCILTGFPFDYSRDVNYRSRPFAPSIDRKNNLLGYTADNIQLVCCIVNKAKNEYTQEMFDAMCIARARKINGET